MPYEDLLFELPPGTPLDTPIVERFEERPGHFKIERRYEDEHGRQWFKVIYVPLGELGALA